jgi:hypothetical protein
VKENWAADSLTICRLFTKYYEGNKMEKDLIGGVRSTQRRHKKYVKEF